MTSTGPVLDLNRIGAAASFAVKSNWVKFGSLWRCLGFGLPNNAHNMLKPRDKALQREQVQGLLLGNV